MRFDIKEAECVTESWRDKHHFIPFGQTLKENKASSQHPSHVMLVTFSLIKKKRRLHYLVETLNVFALISQDH